MAAGLTELRANPDDRRKYLSGH
ncbi:hypothetical protein MESS4_20024 [Mesorhizobium sp. STM 4661]|nr:hypothetical protein MESS4_20024 [Mesorhizobium sp. STM 4661]